MLLVERRLKSHSEHINYKHIICWLDEVLTKRKLKFNSSEVRLVRIIDHIAFLLLLAEYKSSTVRIFLTQIHDYSQTTQILSKWLFSLMLALFLKFPFIYHNAMTYEGLKYGSTKYIIVTMNQGLLDFTCSVHTQNPLAISGTYKLAVRFILYFHKNCSIFGQIIIRKSR